MACCSMTGYGQAVAEGAGMRVSAEVRTVNHRFLEVAVRLPREWISLEEDVRKLVQARMARGRVDVYIAVEPADAEGRARVDWDLLASLCRLEAKAVSRLASSGMAPEGVRAWLQYPGVLQVAARTVPPDEVRGALLHAVAAAADKAVQARAREGERLCADLRAKAAALAETVQALRAAADGVPERLRQRLRERLAAAGLDVDDARLWQEVVLYADRGAIDEEVVRLQSHLAELAAALAGDGPVGRRLDFIVQEMQRELNTIGAKSTDAAISRLVVDGKVIVEQMREQAQNLE